MSINWWIKEQKLVHPYSRILFGHEKGWKVQSWEIQTKPESGNSMWRELWNQVLWEVTGESASVGTLNGPGVLTGWERKRDVTGTEVPGFCLDMTEVVLMHHTNHAQTTSWQRWHTQVWTQWLPVLIPPDSLMPVTMGGPLICSVPIFGHVYNKKITHMFTLMACSRRLKLI